MGRFMQSIQGEPSPTVRDGGGKIPIRGVLAGKLLQYLRQVLAQGLGLKELPLFECRTVLQVKALQEICLVETGCFLQCLPAGRAQVLSISIPFMMMLAKLFQARVKILYIQADGKIGMETDLILGNQKGIFAQQCL